MAFIVRLRKEGFKFSCSHFTIFGPKSAERLHGHNYYVGVSCKVPDISKELGLAFDFNDLKPLIKKVCDSLDETILIPEESPHLEIAAQKTSVKVNFSSKEYVFPKEDVTLLPLVNITSEELARFIAYSLIGQIKQRKIEITELAVTVKETQGQSVTFLLNT
jgi:6-pyruvoyltetrahydropterin/6-carboxytetrahydropterin synthase